MFKIYRKKDNLSFLKDNNEQSYSLLDFLHKKQKFFRDKIFEITLKANSSQKFKYVQIKINKVQTKKMIVQLIDVSDKILYNEVKAEQTFLTLINAAVSHELRNPLQSLMTLIYDLKNTTSKS
jgi:signal transduction histidine kinase